MPGAQDGFFVADMLLSKHSDPKLDECTADFGFRSKVAAVLKDTNSQGCGLRIFEAKRTFEQQKAKVAKGYSKTLRSYHLKRGSDGGAMAADIASTIVGWNWHKRQQLMLGSAAMAHGLGWGGLFGLSDAQKLKVVRAIIVLREEKWPTEHELYKTILGWDEAHVQVANNWPK